MAKKTPLTEKNRTELTSMLVEMRSDLRASRFAAAGSRPKDTDAHARIRKEIARVLYELGMRAKAAPHTAA